MSRLTSFPALRLQRGFSIVELMISVVIGMMALLFATRMITSSEQGRQAALGGSDSMQNGMMAMFSISNDANQAGFGLNDPILAGCNTSLTDSGGYALAAASRNGTAVTPLAPAVIVDGGLNSDVISINSGGALAGTATVRLTGNYTGGTALEVDREPFGFDAGDVIVVAPEKPNPASALCTLRQLSVKPPFGAAAKSLNFASGTGFRYNSGDMPASYDGGGARVFNLGPAAKLSFHTWSVENGYLKLRATDIPGTGANAAAVADNIVSIKAMYGLDTRAGIAFDPEKGTKVGKWSARMNEDLDGDGVVGGSGDYQRVVALRLAVVARSKAPERPLPGQACNATPDAKRPVVFAAIEPAGGADVSITPNVVIAGDAVDWKCYHYRVFETIIPIRNSAWRPTAWTK